VNRRQDEMLLALLGDCRVDTLERRLTPREEDDTWTGTGVDGAQNRVGELLPPFLAVRIRLVRSDGHGGVDEEDTLSSPGAEVAVIRRTELRVVVLDLLVDVLERRWRFDVRADRKAEAWSSVQ